GDPVDHLLDEHGLADTGTTEQTDLAALQVGADQVEDLDSGLEDLVLRLDLFERRRVAVNRPAGLGEIEVRGIERLAPDVEDVTERLVTDRDRDRRTGVDDLGATHQAVRRSHGNGARSEEHT